VARRDGQPVGCGAIRRIDQATGELKRMFVAPESRGLGIGKLLAQNAALNFEWTTSARKRLRGYAEGVYELSI